MHQAVLRRPRRADVLEIPFPFLEQNNSADFPLLPVPVTCNSLPFLSISVSRLFPLRWLNDVERHFQIFSDVRFVIFSKSGTWLLALLCLGGGHVSAGAAILLDGSGISDFGHFHLHRYLYAMYQSYELYLPVFFCLHFCLYPSQWLRLTNIIFFSVFTLGPRVLVVFFFGLPLAQPVCCQLP